ncbi:hypothetical protein [Xanthomonas sp. NCPPB 1128]|uniref:hypothetical protein n=1 Tax=Xanthomonas sp. NCPPB 1128 TaxID=1775876 RepID=UPI00103F978A|nr:hypothetical protein [Xanthomonas sp. NCPPB 1128]
MIGKNFDWKAALGQLFSATVNQQTLEEAAELMVSVSSNDDDYHDECLYLLDSAIHAAESGDLEVLNLINGSGYKVYDINSAIELLSDFKSIYMCEFNKA